MFAVCKILIVSLVLGIVYKLVKIWQCLAKMQNIPMMWSGWGLVTFFGVVLLKTSHEIFETFENVISNSTETKKFFTGPKIIICPVTPEDIHTISISPHCFDKADAYELIPGQTSLLISKYDMWKQHRRLLNPTLNLQMTKSFFNIFNDVAKEFVNDLDIYARNNEICDLMQKSLIRITDTTMRANFGKHLNLTQIKSLVELIHTTMEQVGHDTVGYYTGQFGLHQIRTLIKKITKYDIAHERCMRIVNLLRPLIFNDRDTTVTASGETENLMTRLSKMYLSGVLSDEQLNDQMVVFLLAAIDTTSIAVSNILLCLAMYPDVQDKVYDEIECVLGKEFNSVDIESLQHLHYFDRVVKECMRVTPIIPILVRQNSEEIKLQKGTVPVGSHIIVLLAAIHKNKYIWGEHANDFNPDNFLPENFENKHRCAFIPFGSGPRNCIGNKYAHFVMRVLVVQLVSKYKFTTKLELKNLRYKFGITSTLDGGHLVKIEKRLK